MSDDIHEEARDNLTAAVGIIRGQLEVMTGERSQRNAQEALALEVSGVHDPLALVSALGQFAAAFAQMLAMLGNQPAGVVLDAAEEQLRGGAW